MPDRDDIAVKTRESELDRLARAETVAGMGIPLEDVLAWIDSWDTDQELLPPQARPTR